MVHDAADAAGHREAVGLADAPGKGQALRRARLQLFINQLPRGLAEHVGDDQLGGLVPVGDAPDRETGVAHGRKHPGLVGAKRRGVARV